MSKPDAPQPPNPYATAAAATGTNVGTAVANAFLNNVNQVTPQGSLDYNQTGTYQWHDPVTGSTYDIPRFTATQTLSDTQQAIQGQTEGATLKMAGLANDAAGRMGTLLSNNVDMASAPAGGNANNILGVPQARTSYDAGGQIQTGLGDAGAITKDYGPADNFSADRQRYEDSLMQRMNPQLQQERAGIEQRLADQGIRYGSQAYTSAMDDYNRQSNDARFAAIGQGGQEQQRMVQMAAQRAAFQNEAQGQQYNQNLGMGTFANAAQNQQYTQNAGQASFENAGLAQQLAQQQSGFNAQQAQRNAYLNEQYANRNQQINEVNSLRSGTQVSAPNFVNTPSTQIATTDVAGLINTNFAQQQQNYAQQNASYQQLMGGVLGLGAGALKASDERIKDNVERIGTVFSAPPEKDSRELPIYRYSYKGDPSGARHTGPMAQDVERMDKKAVKTIGGVKHIDTGRVMGSILRAA
jgi:hypothetical protein